MATQRLHNDLTILSHSLTIPDELLKKGNEQMQKIFLLLQKHSDYKLDRCRLLGGVGKKTSISVKFDYDCVIYVNDINPPFEKLLDEWDSILIQRLTELKGDTKPTPYSIQFEVEGFQFDILPAPNYAGFNHDIILQARIIWERISREEIVFRKGQISYLYGSGLSELALQFMEKQSGFIHDLCRLTKFWNHTILFDQYVSGRSNIIECLAVKAGQEEEEAAINDKRSMLRAFRRFLQCLTKHSHISIVFLDFYDKKQVTIDKTPYLIDPVNPYHNFLAGVPYDFLPTLSKYSKETLDRLDKCEKNSGIEFEKLFDAQPDLWNFFAPHIDVNTITTIIGVRQNYNGKSPRLVVRREGFDSNTLEKMKECMTYVLQCLNSIYNNTPEAEEVVERVTKATERFLDRSFYQKDHHWISTTQNHEDYDVTFILPINTKKQDAVYISMNR
jgi:hypothetical protein